MVSSAARLAIGRAGGRAGAFDRLAPRHLEPETRKGLGPVFPIGRALAASRWRLTQIDVSAKSGRTQCIAVELIDSRPTCERPARSSITPGRQSSLIRLAGLGRVPSQITLRSV